MGLRPPRGSKSLGALLFVHFVLVTLLRARHALAEGCEPVRLEYQAHESCPDSDAFLRAILLRTSRVRPARERMREPARTFHVVITLDARERVRGAFWVTAAQNAEQMSSPRTVESNSCAEVFDALTMFAALSVDPGANAHEQAPGTSAQPTGAPQADQPHVGATDPRTRSAHSSPRVRSERTPAREFSLATGFDLGSMSAGTAKPVLATEPFLETRWQRAIRTGIDLSPTLRVALSTFGGDSSPKAVGYAQLRWTNGRLDACPLALVAVTQLRLRPCLSFSGGVLNASARGIAQPASRHVPWWTLGGALRAEWNPGAFSIELTAGLEMPLQRSQLYFEPSTDVYRPPVAFERITLGGIYHFL